MKIQLSKPKKTQAILQNLYIPSAEYGLGRMVSIISVIHFGFWMGQQPSVPEGSSQVLVPSGH